MSSCLGACNNKIGNSNEISTTIKDENNSKVSVVVSFNPLREFVEAVGKDKISVKVMVPEGMEPHDFEPKPRDMESLSKAQVFIYNGLGMEAWAEKTLTAVDNKSLEIVNASKNAEVIKNEEVEHGEYDPHIWLSLKEAKILAKNIKDALVKVDSANKAFYEENYNEFATKLDELYNEYKKKFETVSNKNFVTGHAAFAYLCRDFGLKQNSVEDVFAEGEPTPKKMKDLVDYSKNNNIKVIFMEELASPKVSETLAKEVGAKVEKIYTIESREDNKDYLESMKDNLEKIYNSLK
ncbi:metal ABC transporter substrate-binding protein [Clostridium sp. SYSU_GA19001]|nr:metal ABC transporter substrate-binding protein [Clostridium caldaquaticum]MCM8711477.1 metal ABC transporter substrate-binding protein [Clostridium caldaquaticum]